MVDALRRNQPALTLARSAERMLTTVGRTSTVPSRSVATLPSAAATLVGLPLPFAFVLPAPATLDQHAAAGGGALLEPWHLRT